MNKKVSVVLPVYNGERRVAKAIESVLSQTYENLELIIVNDCSTDNTIEVLRDYENRDRRVKVFENESNQKLPRTLNNGFTHVTGEYLTWTSDDNAFKPEAIEIMVRYLDEHTDIDMVYADFDVVNLDGTFRETKRLFEPDELRFCNAVGACFLYKKELGEKAGIYDPDLFLAEDYEYWIKAYLNGNLYHIQEVLYNYGWHDESLTVTKKYQVYHKTYEAKDKHFQELLSRCVTQEDRNRFYWEMLRLLLEEDERERIKNIYYQQDSEFMKADKKKLLYEKRSRSFGGRIINKWVDFMNF